MSKALFGGRRLILASTSPFRRELLTRLGLPFATRSSDIDETRLSGEDAPNLVARLAEWKARRVATWEPDALIIGSDQAAVLEGEIIGKPGNHQRAVEQLQQASGRVATFYTGLCLLDSASGFCQVAVEPFHVAFRALTSEMIEHYLQREQPYHCAGSFKSEGLGIVLFERLEGDDPTGLIGLPLIRLTRMLEAAGIVIL
ncbi:MAG: septum formation inhibitor Maf [Candidatus Competibacteraceae bacterium]|nr:septum formation inhibitor Maf [Candidatus Competibacteraceae bacterium]MCP5124222.1 septum formation inhibitor Maf [Gammaproteobacteria bacterium]HRX70179.1 Maf family protein [Candidatus Competibacteraceae bacterium]